MPKADQHPNSGHIVWTDLTVPNATDVRDFYQAVLGWEFQSVKMDGYEDFMMLAGGTRPSVEGEQGKCVAGICHACGGNADLPAQWLNYFAVDDLDAAQKAVLANGGQCLSDFKAYDKYRYLVIQDPAGAVCALIENVKAESE